MGLVMLSSLGPVRAALNSLQYARIAWPGLHQVVFRVAPLADAPTALPAWYTLNLASSPGTIIMLTGLLLPLIMPGYSYRAGGAGLCAHRGANALFHSDHCGHPGPG